MLVKDLQLYDELFFFKYFCMSRTIFEELSKWVAPYKIRNYDERTYFSQRETLHGNEISGHLAIAANYRMSPTSVRIIIS